MSFSSRSIVNMHATRDMVLDSIELDHLAPLVFFYGLGSERPQVEFVPGADLPDEPRWLLVHESDMTPRLRQHHGQEIDLDVHARGRIGQYYVRASVLKRHDDQRAVEFGAIGIHLDALDADARQLVLEGKVPFGAILERMAVPHSSHPRGYFRIKIDHRLAELLDANEGATLFGRCNELRHANGRTLADVVEVLPQGL
jgi:chorismate-pyruvate lyase